MSLKATWPIGLISLPMGIITFCLLWLLPDAIAIYDSVPAMASSHRGGPATLFILNSGVFAYLCVIVAERRVGSNGLGAFLFTIPWCVGSIIGSFMLAAVTVGNFSDATWDMLAASLVTLTLVCAIRSWWGTVS